MSNHISSDIFDHLANSWGSWLGSAGDLMRSAALVWPKRQTGVVWVALMLRGYAVENLLKGVWVADGGTLSDGGRFQGIPETKDHRLESMARKVGVSCGSEVRRNLLEALSNAVLHLGRYPVSKKHTQFASHRPGEPVQGSLWCAEYETEFWNLIEELLDRFSWTGFRNDSLPQDEVDRMAKELPRQMLESWRPSV